MGESRLRATGRNRGTRRPETAKRSAHLLEDEPFPLRNVTPREGKTEETEKGAAPEDPPPAEGGEHGRPGPGVRTAGNDGPRRGRKEGTEPKTFSGA